MDVAQKVKIYKSNTDDYHDAFQVFLNHTNQKHTAKEWLDACISELPSKRVFIDAGAGNGKITQWFSDLFEKTIAMEPNEALRRELAAACPNANVMGHTILEAPPLEAADFILSSHVFYYIPAEEWIKNLEKLASWLDPKGVLVVVLQNHQTDCMKMLRHFLNQSFDLRGLAHAFGNHSDKYETTLETVPAEINTKDFESAYTIAEFMLNLLPLENSPARQDVEEYIQGLFAVNGGYRFSCNQDFLQIRQKKS